MREWYQEYAGVEGWGNVIKRLSTSGVRYTVDRLRREFEGSAGGLLFFGITSTGSIVGANEKPTEEQGSPVEVYTASLNTSQLSMLKGGITLLTGDQVGRHNDGSLLLPSVETITKLADVRNVDGRRQLKEVRTLMNIGGGPIYVPSRSSEGSLPLAGTHYIFPVPPLES